MNKLGLFLFAALCGSMIGLAADNKKRRTLWQKFLFIFCGLCFAAFLAPLAAGYWHITDPWQFSCLGFVFALGWQSIHARIRRAIEETRLPFSSENEQEKGNE